MLSQTYQSVKQDFFCAAFFFIEIPRKNKGSDSSLRNKKDFADLKGSFTKYIMLIIMVIFASAALSHNKNLPISKSLHQPVISVPLSNSFSYAIHVLLSELHRFCLQEPIDSCGARRRGQRPTIVICRFIGQSEGKEAIEGSICIDFSRIEDVVFQSMIDFEENPDHKKFPHNRIIKYMHEMDLQRIADTVNCVFRRLVKMELRRFEDVVVCLVREPDPRIVGQIGLDVLVRRASELHDWILPIDLISFGWRTDVEILLARNVNRGLVSPLVAASRPVSLVEVVNAVGQGQQEDQAEENFSYFHKIISDFVQKSRLN